jgi:hypothetical protein
MNDNGKGKDLNRKGRQERKGCFFEKRKKRLGPSWRSLRPLRLAPLPFSFNLGLWTLNFGLFIHTSG